MTNIKEIVQKLMKTNFKFNTNVPILVVTDTSTEQLGTDFYEALQALGWDATVQIMEDRTRSGEEPDPFIAAEMLKYGIVFCLTKHSLTHTVARRQASEQGISVITMPGINEDIFFNGAINADYRIVEEETSRVAERLTEHKQIVLQTGNNLELTIPLGDRNGIASTGVFHTQGKSGNLPSGEAYIAPIEHLANGQIEINGSIAGIGLVTEPIVLTIVDGKLIEATGEQGQQLLAILGDGDGRLLAELGIGTNYAARLTGNILEDEKAKNTVHVAFGSNHTFGGNIKTNVHIDCVTKLPTIQWR